jgi:hypothetical protein
MNIKEIESLLEKYYEGNSSLSEERILREFFLREDVPDYLKCHRPLFQWTNKERFQEVTSPDFDQMLTGHLLEESGKQPISFNRNPNRVLYFTGIAAGILLLVGLFFTYRQDFFNPMRVKNNLATELAYAEAREALTILSANFNAGLKQVEHLQKIEKTMDNLQKFNKFYQYQSIIINPDEFDFSSSKPK